MRSIMIALPLSLAGLFCATTDSSNQGSQTPIHVAPAQDEPAETSNEAEAEPSEPEPSSESNGGELVLSDDACETDEDCVPAECCHAAACVGTTNRPDCSDAMCTQECRYGTLDCGGHCLCHEGRCAARLSEPPNIPGVTEAS